MKTQEIYNHLKIVPLHSELLLVVNLEDTLVLVNPLCTAHGPVSNVSGCVHPQSQTKNMAQECHEFQISSAIQISGLL